jgi:hypothetical protein
LGTNRFAYVDFPTSVDVEIAVGLSEQHLDGRKLLIKSSSDFTGRPSSSALPSNLDPSSLVQPRLGVPTDQSTPQTLNKTARKILDRQKNNPGPTLFVGNLGFETTVDSLREMFDAHQRAAGAWLAKEKKEEVDNMIEEETVTKEEEKDEDRDDDDSDDDEDDEEEEDEEEEAVTEEVPSSDEEEEAEEEVIAPVEEIDEDADLTLLPILAAPKRIRSKKHGQNNGADEPVVKEIKDLSKAKDAGIRKIRLGTFEDTGKCKGSVACFSLSLDTMARGELIQMI